VQNTPGRRFSIRMPLLDSDTLVEACKSSKKRLYVKEGVGMLTIRLAHFFFFFFFFFVIRFLFDYGGTLIPHGKPPGSKDLDRILTILSKLTSDPNNSVYVISGRTKINIDQDLGCISRLGLR
jgi:trehalose 6-phosphate synthase/phosphatase